MNLEQKMRERIRAFLDSRCSIFELRDWLENHVQSVADDNGAGVRELSGQAWELIAEYDEDWLSENQVRDQLARRLGRPIVTVLQSSHLIPNASTAARSGVVWLRS